MRIYTRARVLKDFFVTADAYRVRSVWHRERLLALHGHRHDVIHRVEHAVITIQGSAVGFDVCHVLRFPKRSPSRELLFKLKSPIAHELGIES